MTSVTYPTTYSYVYPNLVATAGPTYTYSFDAMSRPIGLTDQNNYAAVSVVQYGGSCAQPNQMSSINYFGATESRCYNTLGQLTNLSVGKQIGMTYNSCIERPPDLPFGDGPHGNFVTATLRFKALSPVLMVHGYNEGPEWFGPPSGSQCTPGGFNFFQAFDQAKIPYVYQEINVRGDAPITIGGARLAIRIDQIATEFGAKHIHTHRT